MLDSALTLLVVILGAFWIGLALDYLPVTLGGTEMPWTARLVGLIVLAGLIGFIVTKMLMGRLRRPLPDDSLALLIERHHPSLGGRLVTAVQLNQVGRTGDTHSPELLQHVHDEAAKTIDQVDPTRIFQQKPLVKKSLVAAPLLFATVGLLLLSPGSFARAATRLTLFSDDPWPRRAHLEMVGVDLPSVTASGEDSIEPERITFDEHRTLRLPRGSNGALRIRARADEESELPVVCTVRYEMVPSEEPDSNPSGVADNTRTRGQSNMRRVGRVVDGYQSFLLDGPPLASLNDSLVFEVRGLDDRLSGFRIEAVTPPAITSMQVGVRYPSYLRDPAIGDHEFDRINDYQSGLRLAEGSGITLIATSSLPLGDTDVMVASINEEPISFELDYSDDRSELQIQIQIQIQSFTSAMTVSIVPRDANGISAQSPYRYFLGLVTDESPEIKVRLAGIGSAVTAIARIPVELQASDDYGIDQLVISVTPSTSDETRNLSVTKDLGETNPIEEKGAPKSAQIHPILNREGKANSELDLRDLIAAGTLGALAPGDAVNVLGEATDRYDLNGKHITRSEIYRLEIVTPEDLLALLERRELGLRSRLEQTITEARSLRDTLSLLERGFDEVEQGNSEKGVSGELATDSTKRKSTELETTRRNQVRRLRIQQCGLQANKTSEELTGIAQSLDDLLREMINNRVDSADRRERIGSGVRDPLREIVTGSLDQLKQEINAVETQLKTPTSAMKATRQAIVRSEEVLLQLTAVLERMLDLESYHEILDMVRGLIDDQDTLIDDTKRERKKRVLDLFQ